MFSDLRIDILSNQNGVSDRNIFFCDGTLVTKAFMTFALWLRKTTLAIGKLSQCLRCCKSWYMWMNNYKMIIRNVQFNSNFSNMFKMKINSACLIVIKQLQLTYFSCNQLIFTNISPPLRQMVLYIGDGHRPDANFTIMWRLSALVQM